MYIFMCIYMYIYLFMCIYIYIYMYIFNYVYIHKYRYICTHTLTHTYTHAHAHTLIYNHTACLDERYSTDVREAAACALGCLTSFYEPAQLAVVRSSAALSLLGLLQDTSAAPLVSVAADAVANCALAPANHAQLLALGTVVRALWVCACLCVCICVSVLECMSMAVLMHIPRRSQ